MKEYDILMGDVKTYSDPS